MAKSILDNSRQATRRATVPTAVADPTTYYLAGIITALLGDSGRSSLPDWTYGTWCRALAYPDLHTQPRATTEGFVHMRDEALSCPAVRLLIEWAGSRRRDDPAAGAAAALAMVRLGVIRSGDGPVDVSELTSLVAVKVDSAKPVRSSFSYRPRLRLLADPDRLPAVDPGPAATENPRLSAAVGQLLRLAGAELDVSLATSVEDSVVQAGDWWTRHASPVPVSIDGPRLPGVLPAEHLHPPERVQAQVSQPALLGLVAGPNPGRSRPCQVAWRRGLTFWVAVRLSTTDFLCGPPVDTIRWWRAQLSALGCGLAALRPSARLASATPTTP